MCGAGTAAIEAALLARHIPPGSGREYLFEHWPGHEAKTWEYLRRKAQEGILPRAPGPIVALDQDRRALHVARDNASRAGVQADIRWEQGDFLAFHHGALQLAPGLVILDPPYGVRMQGADDLPAFYRQLGAHLREAFKGWQAAVAAPTPELARALGFRRQRLWRLPHGGIPLSICLVTIG
jgi:23S rRNA G2445 N2-methylase RlmL